MTTFSMPLQHPPKITYMGVGHLLPEGHNRFVLKPKEWAFHLYSYGADLFLDQSPHPFTYGSAGICPPLKTMSYKVATPSQHVFVIMNLQKSSTSRVSFPPIIDLKTQFPAMLDRAMQAIGYFSSEPRRAESKIWDLLWDISKVVSDVSQTKHPALEFVIGEIERNISQPLRVAQLAQKAGVSHNHLTRLFRASLNKTVEQYIRHRRAWHAAFLLKQSSRPIKMIAAEVGISDLQLFNKLMRREHGLSPRHLRERKL